MDISSFSLSVRLVGVFTVRSGAPLPLDTSLPLTLAAREPFLEVSTMRQVWYQKFRRATPTLPINCIFSLKNAQSSKTLLLLA